MGRASASASKTQKYVAKVSESVAARHPFAQLALLRQSELSSRSPSLNSFVVVRQLALTSRTVMTTRICCPKGHCCRARLPTRSDRPELQGLFVLSPSSSHQPYAGHATRFLPTAQSRSSLRRLSAGGVIRKLPLYSAEQWCPRRDDGGRASGPTDRHECYLPSRLDGPSCGQGALPRSHEKSAY